MQIDAAHFGEPAGQIDAAHSRGVAMHSHYIAMWTDAEHFGVDSLPVGAMSLHAIPFDAGQTHVAHFVADSILQDAV
mgnify:CR=1 FL=1